VAAVAFAAAGAVLHSCLSSLSHAVIRRRCIRGSKQPLQTSGKSREFHEQASGPPCASSSNHFQRLTAASASAATAADAGVAWFSIASLLLPAALSEPVRAAGLALPAVLLARMCVVGSRRGHSFVAAAVVVATSCPVQHSMSCPLCTPALHAATGCSCI
jgi:hypothetical protein